MTVLAASELPFAERRANVIDFDQASAKIKQERADEDYVRQALMLRFLRADWRVISDAVEVAVAALKSGKPVEDALEIGIEHATKCLSRPPEPPRAA